MERNGIILPLVSPEKISVVCRKVELFDDSFQEIVDNMIATILATNNGVGLAANQVGYDLAVAVIRPYLHDRKLTNETLVIVNPQIETKPWITKITDEEGCLSFPGRFEPISRFKTVLLRGANRIGEDYSLRVHGHLARIIQHEVDHLNGLVCFDKATKFETLPKNIKNKRRKYARRHTSTNTDTRSE